MCLWDVSNHDGTPKTHSSTTSITLTPQIPMPPLFKDSSHFVASGTFVDRSLNVNFGSHGKSWGIDLLRNACLPQAMHDSSARSPPLCHPGTREKYVHNIIDWGSGGWKRRRARNLWLKGPAGVGKSALAQTCAEKLQAIGKMGAGFFFFRANKWNDPLKFFPTIVYQLTTKLPAYHDIIDTIISKDPLVLEKSIGVQFQELLVKPFATLSTRGLAVSSNMVIIVDGLDECDGVDMQRVIVEVITASASQETTPFLWAFFSRPEPHITAAFSSEQASNVCWQLTLPISREADSDIEAYLRDVFRTIRTKYSFPATMAWPSEDEIRQLVDRSAGLFAYAACVIRYVGQDTGAFGPEERLELVLELEKDTGGRSDNPFASLDQLYLLIMRQVPKALLADTLLLLCIHLYKPWGDEDKILYYCSTLGLSLSVFLAAMNNLHSVINIEKHDDGMPHRLSFYHASFADFLQDATRSTSEFCIEVPDVHAQCLERSLDTLCCMSKTNRPSANLRAWSNSEKSLKRLSGLAITCLFDFAQRTNLDDKTLWQLSQINWNLNLNGNGLTWVYSRIRVDAFIQKIPNNWRPQIVDLCEDEASEGKLWRRRCLLGSGSGRVEVMWNTSSHYFFMAYQ